MMMNVTHLLTMPHAAGKKVWGTEILCFKSNQLHYSCFDWDTGFANKMSHLPTNDIFSSYH